MNGRQGSGQRPRYLEQCEEIVPWRKQRGRSEVSRDTPQLLVVQLSKVLCQGCIEREFAAGLEVVPLEAQANGVEQMQIGRLHVGEIKVIHESLPLACQGEWHGGSTVAVLVSR